MTKDPDVTLLTWFLSVGYFLARHEMAQELRGLENKLETLNRELGNVARAVEGKLDTLSRDLELRVDRALEEVREGRGFTSPSGLAPCSRWL